MAVAVAVAVGVAVAVAVGGGVMGAEVAAARVEVMAAAMAAELVEAMAAAMAAELVEAMAAEAAESADRRVRSEVDWVRATRSRHHRNPRPASAPRMRTIRQEV